MPASDTGAMEMAMWSLLGPLEIDIFAWESFGEDWVTDTVKQLKLKAEVHKAAYGEIPDLKAAKNRDVVFLWNGTTSGVKVPNGDWIPADRDGITICDATSAAFAMDLPWDKLDVTTFSWQKVLGGEAAHGMLVLSPNAVTRLENLHATLADAKNLPHDQGRQVGWTASSRARPSTPRPCWRSKTISRQLRHGRKAWAGWKGLIRALQRQSVGAGFMDQEMRLGRISWPRIRRSAPTLRSASRSPIPGSRRSAMTPRPTPPRRSPAVLEKESVALDIAGYRSAPPGLRIWCGATVDTADLEALTPWLDWAWAQVKQPAAA